MIKNLRYMTFKKHSFLIISSIIIFSFWLVMIGFLVKRNSEAAGRTVSLREMASFKPPVSWQWSGIYQSGQPVGLSSIYISEDDREGQTFYNLRETDKLRINLNGLEAKTSLQLDATVDSFFALQNFSVEALLNDNHFKASGYVTGQILHLTTYGSQGEQKQDFVLGKEVYLPLTFTPYLASYQFKVGEKYTLETFDPLSLGLNKVEVKVLEKKEMEVLGEKQEVTKLEVNLADIISYLYIDDQGRRVKEEIPDQNLEARAIEQKEYYQINKELNIPNP